MDAFRVLTVVPSAPPPGRHSFIIISSTLCFCFAFSFVVDC
jgi:hypothetical protein